MASLRSTDPALPTPRPLFVAARRWNELDEAGCQRLKVGHKENNLTTWHYFPETWE